MMSAVSGQMWPSPLTPDPEAPKRAHLVTGTHLLHLRLAPVGKHINAQYIGKESATDRERELI